MENVVLVTATLTVAAVLLAAGTVIAVLRRRARRGAAVGLDWIARYARPSTSVARRAEAIAETLREDAVAGSLEVRLLRSQVRTLEEALEVEQQLATEQDATAGLDAHRRQVDAVIRAMGRRLDASQSAPESVARISAALDRLTFEGRFTRPALSPAGAVVGLLERPATHAPAGALPPAQHDVASYAPSAVGLPEFPAYPEPDAPELDVAAVAPVASGESEVVLPVPPMAESDGNQRNRRWFRGRAA
jgi:hypothetical protein